MKGTAQVVKGRIKEAAGALTGNEDLRVSGRVDQTAGQMKQVAEKGVRQVEASVQKIADKVKDLAKKAID